jgi:hypothetical protein
VLLSFSQRSISSSFLPYRSPSSATSGSTPPPPPVLEDDFGVGGGLDTIAFSALVCSLSRSIASRRAWTSSTSSWADLVKAERSLRRESSLRWRTCAARASSSAFYIATRGVGSARSRR